MKKRELTYQDLIDFSIALDTHILTTRDFFDAEFLNLVEEYLGYTNCSFIIYESNHTYICSVGHNVPMDKDYEDEYLGRDPLAKYITANYEHLVSRENKVIKSSEVFENYLSCEYHSVLNSISGQNSIDYAAVIPFDNLRLTVYKSAADGDFTKHELNLLNIVEQIVSSKYSLFAKVIKPPYELSLEELKNMYFETSSTGVIILNSRYELLDCNRIGEEYIQKLAPSLTISDYFRSLIPLLNISPLTESGSSMDRVAKLDDYIINIKRYLSRTSATYCENVFFITISCNAVEQKLDNEATTRNMHQLQSDFREKYALTEREMDIVEALSNGKKYQDIADTLYISINTVRTHVKNIYRKFEINNQRSLLYVYNQFFYSGK